MTDNNVTLIVSPTDERFWSKVEVRGLDQCWPWTAALGSTGYGQYRSDSGRTVKAHRFVAGAHPGEVVMHLCDNPPCCNPAHLRIGTVAENVADMVSKGRHLVKRALPVGSANRHAKVSESDVLAMRERAAAGETHAALGAEFDLYPTTVSLIVRGEAWRHVGGPITRKRPGRPRKKAQS